VKQNFIPLLLCELSSLYICIVLLFCCAFALVYHYLYNSFYLLCLSSLFTFTPSLITWSGTHNLTFSIRFSVGLSATHNFFFLFKEFNILEQTLCSTENPVSVCIKLTGFSQANFPAEQQEAHKHQMADHKTQPIISLMVIFLLWKEERLTFVKCKSIRPTFTVNSYRDKT